MYLVLLLVGVLVSAAGFVTIGFGIPINAFSLGNTLIIAGTTAVAGGLVVIALAVVVRHLRRIADLLAVRPVAAKAQRPADVAETLAPPTARIAPAAPSPVPTRPVAPRPPEAAMPRPPEAATPRPSELRLNELRPSVAPRYPLAGDAPGPLDWMRPKSKPSSGPMEPPVVEIHDEAPLSPRPPQRPLFSPPPLSPVAAEPPLEPRHWMSGRGGDVTEAKPLTAPMARSEQILRSEPLPRTEHVARAEPVLRAGTQVSGDEHVSAPEHVARVAPSDDHVKESETAKDESKETGLFDVVWPDVRASAATVHSETATRETKSEAVATPPQSEPDVADKPAAAEHKETPSPERSTAILKSGVIDGMGYTLYADGSIQAEMPEGTVTFASVDELRAHLEQNA